MAFDDRGNTYRVDRIYAERQNVLAHDAIWIDTVYSSECLNAIIIVTAHA
jgi:hypothetical protein